MEIILLILAGVVVYYLYITLQEYLKNPITPQSRDTNIKIEEYDISQDPYVQANPLDKIKKSEFGIMAAIVSKITPSKGANSIAQTPIQTAQAAMIDGLFASMRAYANGANSMISDLKEIYASSENTDLEQLCKDLLQATYGEYKKRLKFVEFLFALCYISGTLSDTDKENIIDVAAFLELSNEDFNKIYDDFSIQNQAEIAMDNSLAHKILGVQEGALPEVVLEKFQTLIAERELNILDTKNLNKSLATGIFIDLRQLTLAFEFLSKPQGAL
ncbi:hypothetical protein BKH46_02320 [Helicobacter sp. 12S02634-8]|uniref:hypothetical protein n=1 Tax=Helicobacter sp. 12S02634-8 TaxID=1476199 RepID=UPI000BA5A92A|nr:hypothetical protein [Helicobacter sp. 12S02634-8]PAF48162.1 hypothetical protein BKH46_02320 [Helicobacter sp. 12S02634-8]